jgi:hypothetical protein
VKVNIVYTVMSLVHHILVQYFGHTFIVDLHVLLSWSFDNQMRDFPERLPRKRSMSDWRLEEPLHKIEILDQTVSDGRILLST